MNKKLTDLLIGLSIGDTVGVPFEFKNRSNIKGPISNIGGGVFNLEKGQPSDDTELSLIVLDTVLDLVNKDYNYIKDNYKEIITSKYLKWYNSSPPDIGITTKKSFFNIDKKKVTGSPTSKSNGVLMRASPLGYLGVKLNNKELYEIIKIDCNITHLDSFVLEIVYIYCKIIKYLFLNYSLSYIKNKIQNISNNQEILKLINDSFIKPEPVFLNNKQILTDDSTFMGYIGIAFQNCLYELFNGTSYDSSIINIIKRGGDTDTNACIAGAVLGLYYGFNNINTIWIDNMINSKYERKKKFKKYDVNYFLNKLKI